MTSDEDKAVSVKIAAITQKTERRQPKHDQGFSWVLKSVQTFQFVMACNLTQNATLKVFLCP